MKKIILLNVVLLIVISPISFTQWTSIGGPEGGVIAAITNAGSYIVCGADDGDIFTSVDNGAAWTKRGKAPGGMIRLTAGSNAIFARTGTGFYKSTDQGETWEPRLDQGIFIGKVFASGTKVLAPTGNGLFYSTDSGDSWTNVTGNLPVQVHAAVIHNGDMFAGMLDSAVYRSTNNGATWFRAWNITTRRNINFLATFGNTLYAAYSSEARLFSSTDNGVSWNQSDVLAIGTIIEYVNDLLITSSGIVVPVLYQTSSSLPWEGGVYISTNGTSWFSNNDGLIPRQIAAVASAQGDILAASRGGGIFRSTNQGQSWIRSSSGLVKSRILHLSYTNGGEKFYSSVYGGGFFISNDSANTWEARNTGFENIYPPSIIIGEFLIKGNSWFAGIEEDGLYKSTNQGLDWFKAGMGPFPFTGLAPRGNDIFATQAVSDGVFRSVDDGFSWTQIMSGFITIGPTCLTIGGAGTIFVGTLEGSILRSTNNGTNWVGSYLGGSTFPRYIRFIGSTMFAGTTNGVYRSTNFGLNWIPSNNGMELAEVNFIAIQDTNTLFATTFNQGLFVSLDNGNSWFAFNDGLPTLELDGVRVLGSHLYCGTRGYGIWKRPISSIVTDIDEDITAELPDDFILGQNYPNPFNPTTSIQYQVSSISQVTLKVYDVLGNEVSTLVQEEKPAGVYEVAFNASQLASGMYLYRLQAGSFIETKKMILIK